MITADQGKESRDTFAVNANRQLRQFPKYQNETKAHLLQQENKTGALSFDPRLLMENDIYSHGTELYVDRPSSDNYAGRQGSYNHEQAVTPKDQFTMSQLAGSKGPFMFGDINDLKEQAAHYGSSKYGTMMTYNKVPKVEEYEFPQGGEYYLNPAVASGQQDMPYSNWHGRSYPMYADTHIAGSESINSTVDGDSVDEIDDTIGPDGTLPPANKRDPIYTAISGLKWKAKSKKWVVRWDNPITNRRVYKYFSGVRYGFMGAHKRAKYYLEFLNASVGRLEAPSVGNPFCRRTEGPPKGKTNKGLMRRLMNRGIPDPIGKPPSVMYAYKPAIQYQGNMEYAHCVNSSVYDQQPKYGYGSTMKDPYCLEDGAIGGY